MTETTPTFFIGNLPIYGDAILAPMDGYSDWPFRSLCRSLGSAMSYTEFVKSEDIVHLFRRVRAKLTYEESERLVTFQIYGDDPDMHARSRPDCTRFRPGHYRY
jgi:tRNA-dihydrouridine synthase B